MFFIIIIIIPSACREERHTYDFLVLAHIKRDVVDALKFQIRYKNKERTERTTKQIKVLYLGLHVEPITPLWLVESPR